MRFKHRSTARVEERPEGFYQPPAGAQNGGEASSEGNPSARPASADRTQRSARRPRNGKLLRPLWWSMPVVAVTLAVGTYMVSLPLWAWTTGRTVRAGNHEAALTSYSRQIYWGDLGPASWVAHYNAGTEDLRLDHIDSGVEQLRTAWDRVPKARQVEDGRIETYSYECTVRMNLALGLEKQGDAAMASDRAQAAALYKEMGEVVSPCQSTSSTQNQQNQQGQGGGADADKAHDRAKQKQEQAEKSDNKDDQNKDNKDDKDDKNKDDKDDKDDKNKDDKQDQNKDKKDDKDQQTDKKKDPYDGETDEQRKKREEMQRRIEKGDQDGRKEQDRKRGTGGNGAW